MTDSSGNQQTVHHDEYRDAVDKLLDHYLDNDLEWSSDSKYVTEETRQALANKLRTFSDSTRKMILSFNDLEISLPNSSLQFLYRLIYGETEQRIREVMTYLPHFRVYPKAIPTVINGLYQYGLFSDYSSVEHFAGADRSRAIALINTAAVLRANKNQEAYYFTYNERKPSMLIKNQELVNLVVEHHEQVDKIVNCLQNCMTIDVTLLREKLTTTAPLQDGVL